MDDILPPSDDQDQSIIEPTLQAAANAAENLIGKIQMINIDSTDISQWGYDPVKFQLQILFTNNRMYLYENISPVDFEQLSLAPSKGKAFWALIRHNPVGHPFTRLQ